MIKGVDVSNYQTSTFSLSGLDFVMVKATESTNYVNPKMAAQAAHARAGGLVVGFYHFARPGAMKAQAAYFVSKAASLAGDLLFLDWEDAGISSAQKDTFIAEVKRLRGSDHRVGLYCNQNFWLNREKGGKAGDALWIADYVSAGKPRITAKWLFHQYTDSPLDTNVANFASRAALKSWATVKTTTPPVKPVEPVKPATPVEHTMTQAQQVEALYNNLLQVGSLVEKDTKGNPVKHGAGYYLAHTEDDTSKILAILTEILEAIKALKA